MFKLLLLVTLCLSSSVFAEATAEKAATVAPVFQKTGYQFVGLNLGAEKPVGKERHQTPIRLAYGLEYSYAVMDQLSVGVIATRSDAAAGKESETDLSLLQVGVKAAYNPTYDSVVSLTAGKLFYEYSSSGVGTSISIKPDSDPFYIAPGLGLIFPIIANVQMIPNISYSFVLENDDVDSFQIFDAGVSFRYQF